MLHELSTLNYGFKNVVEWKGWPPSKEEVTPLKKGVFFLREGCSCSKQGFLSCQEERG